MMPIIVRSTRYRWLFILLGALLVVGLSLITTIEPAQEEMQPASHDLALAKVRRIEQTLTTTQRDLVGFTMPLHLDAPSESTQPITLAVRLPNTVPIERMTSELALNSVEDGQLRVQFAPLPVSQQPHTITGTIQIIVSIPEQLPGSFATFESSSAGLVLDGMVQPARALAITPLYQHRWFDSLWPISALAADKPGLLGWPPLYPLLAYLWFVVLIMAGSELYQSRSDG